MVAESVAFLENNPEAGAVFTAAQEIGSDGETIGERRYPASLPAGAGHAYSFDEIFAAILRNGNFLICPSALVRTGIYKNEIRAWNGEKYKTSADLDVWLRIAEKHQLGLIDRPLIKYRVSAASYSYNIARLRTERHDMFLVLEEYVRKDERLVSGNKGGQDYRLLILKDDINIAINHLISGNAVHARKRLNGIFKLDNFADSLGSSLQFKLLLYGYAAWLISFLPLGRLGRSFVLKARHNA